MKTLIPEDFEITEKLRKWAEDKVPYVDIDVETEKFVDYWLSHGKKMANWDATWRNWMRRAPQFGGAMKRVSRSAPEQVTDEQRREDQRKWERDMERLGVSPLSAASAGRKAR